MAQTIFLPTPAGVLVPTFNADRGAQLFDTVSKSSVSKTVIYDDTNACGDVAYTKASAAINISELINCVPTQNTTVSISVSVPKGASNTAMRAVIDYLATRIQTDYSVFAL